MFNCVQFTTRLNVRSTSNLQISLIFNYVYFTINSNFDHVLIRPFTTHSYLQPWYINKHIVIFSGVVFLRFAGLSRRALLPNEVTSMDTVKALFVRSFPNSLTLSWFDRNDSMVFLRPDGSDTFIKLRDFRYIFVITLTYK